ncbi:Ig-like domain-containing protein [Cohnella caldifontis]|uniref:Ig-like domain-containing protein n=1 Tax=Cohnella caldifontis TaxID=3027471 RepID=UPI0023EDBEB5|nr:Ig-like domain-containing protein [Cohnella sp. YIM B05605]
MASRTLWNKILTAWLAVALIAGSFASVAGAATVTLSKLILSASDVTLEIGSTFTLTATGVYSDSSTKNVTVYTDWSSENAAVASVYNGTITAKTEGTATIVAVYEDMSQSVNVIVTKKVKALTKDAQTLNLRKNDSATIGLTATYSDNSTENVADKADWTSSNEKVATVVNGKVTGLSSGTAVITAQYGSKSVTVDVNVEIVNRVEADKKQVSLLLQGTQSITLTATYPDGTTRNVTSEAKWSSSDDEVAGAVNGVIKGYGSGTATITAEYGTKKTTISVDVDKTMKLGVDADSVFLHVAQTRQLKLTAVNADGNETDVTASATWTSSNESVAFVNKGLITGVKSGTATVKGTYNGKTVEIAVDVDTPRYLDINPSKITLKAKEKAEVKLTATYADGSTEDVTSIATWTTSKDEVALVLNGQIVTFSMGAAVIKGTYGGKSASVSVSVDLPSKLTASSKSVSIGVEEDYQAVLTAQYADEHTDTVTEAATWTSSDESKATVKDGLITGVAQGTATITASFGEMTVKITVNVGLAAELEPSSRLLSLSLGNSEQVKLTATDASGVSRDVTAEAKWLSNKPTVADVKKGLVTAYGQGNATITATYGGQSVAITVRVDQVTKIEVSDLSVSLKTGGSAQVKVVATFVDGKTLDVTNQADWATTAFRIATVKSGKITAAGPGKTTVTVKYAGKSAKVAVDVDTLKYYQTNEVSITLKVGQQMKLTATATYADGSEADVTVPSLWTSSKITVVTVKDGIVKATGKGKATITAAFAGKNTKVIVTVK